MNLATLGILLDPTSAKQGAAEAVKAINSTGEAAVANEKKVQEATARTGKAVGDNAKKGAEEHGAATKKMQEANERLHSQAAAGANASRGAFAQMIATIVQGVTQMASAIPGATGGLAAITGGAASAATSIAAMAMESTALLPILAALAVAAAAAVVVLGSLAAAFALVAVGVKKASAMEDATMSFAVLLGSIQAARARMEELSKFAAETPFELPEVVAASRQLELFTDGALSSGKGLKLVGDAAAAFGLNYEEVARGIGRLYQSLQNGTPMGEAAQQLRNMGLLLGPLQSKLEQLQAQGKKGPEVWDLYAKSLERFDNAMQLKNMTMSGQLSNLADNISRVLTALGTGQEQALTPVISKLAEWVNGLVPKAKQIGDSIAAGFATLKGMMESGTMGEALSTTLQIAFDKAVNALIKGVLAGLAMIGPVIIMQIQGTAGVWDALASDFGKNLGLFLLAALVDFGNRLLEVMLNPLAAFKAGIEQATDALLEHLPAWMGGTGGEKIAFDWDQAFAGAKAELTGIIGQNKAMITETYNTAGAVVKQKIAEWNQDFQRNLALLAETSKELYKSLGDFIPTERIEALEAQLKALAETSRKLGTVANNDDAINKLIPPKPTRDLNAEAVDEARKAIKTDEQMIEEFRKNREYLAVLLRNDKVSPTEAQRRLTDLQDKTGNALEDPQRYSSEIGKWRAFQEEKERIAKATDDRVKNNELSAFQAMGEGLKRHAQAWGNMNQQIMKATGQVMDALVNGISGALSEIISGTKTAGQAFADMAKAILGEIVKIITKLLIQFAIQMAINAITGQSSFANMGSAANGNFVFAGKADGGVVVAPSGGSSTPSGYTTPATTGSSVNAPGMPSGGGMDSLDMGDIFSGEGISAPPAFRTPEMDLRFARGGRIRGGSGFRDDIPIMAMGGEYVMRKDAVNQYGIAFMDAINRGQAPKRYADGGIVGPSAAMAANQGSRSGDGGVHVNVGVNMGDSGGDSNKDESGGKDRKKLQEFGRHIDGAVRQIITREKRPGGLLDRGAPMS